MAIIQGRIDTQSTKVGYIVEYQVQTEAVADEIEVVTLPRPGAARTATFKSLPVSEPNLQEDETGALGEMSGFPCRY